MFVILVANYIRFVLSFQISGLTSTTLKAESNQFDQKATDSTSVSQKMYDAFISFIVRDVSGIQVHAVFMSLYMVAVV